MDAKKKNEVDDVAETHAYSTKYEKKVVFIENKF